MIMPSDLNKEMENLKRMIRLRLQAEANILINEEIESILGRVKILTVNDLQGNYSWFIEPEKKSET